MKFRERTEGHFEAFFERNAELRELEPALRAAVGTILETVRAGKKILICGNGGSTADSEHMAGELLKSFVLKRRISEGFRDKLVSAYGAEGEWMAENLQQGLKCIPLTSFCAYNTAFLNDCNEKMLFAQLVNALGEAGDVLVALSTSGNSGNVVAAVKIARALGIKVISLTGRSGGKMKELSDVLLNVPADETFRVQEYHLPVYHLLCLAVESECFDA